MAIRSVVCRRSATLGSLGIFRKGGELLFLLGGIFSTVHAATLQWDRNLEPDIAGYKVFWGETNSTPTVVDVGNTNRRAFKLTAGKAYVFRVAAYNSANLESALSAPIYYNSTANSAPTIASVANQTIAVNSSTGPLNFTVSDGETAAGSLSVSAASSNTNLVAVSGIVFGGTNSARTVRLTPLQQKSGSSQITLMVSDGQLTATTSFTLVVNAPPPNTAPAIASIPNQTIAMNSSAGPLSFTVSDGETAPGALTVSAASSNTNLLPVSGIVFGGTNSTRTVRLTPLQQKSGSSQITLTVSDGQFAATTSFTLAVNAPTPTNSNGLWLGMGFEETGSQAKDLSSHAHHGTIVAPASRTIAGEYGGVIDFNGGGGMINLGGLDIPGSAVTISCWIRPDSFSISDARLISKATGINETDHVWMLSTIPNNGTKPRMRLKTSTGDTATLIGTANIVAGAWTHLAATYDGSAMRLYVNGQPAGSMAKTGTIVQAPSIPAAIGNQPQGGKSFDGLIDDVRIYTRPLSQTEIQETMHELLGTPAEPAPPADITPPIAPQNLLATILSPNSVRLNWGASTDSNGVSQYRVIRDGTEISTTGGLEYIDSELSETTTYRFEVRAVDAAGNESVPSNAATVTTPISGPSDGNLWLAMMLEESGGYVLDSSTNEHDGILVAPAVRAADPDFGGVLDFNGSGGRVDLGGLDIPGAALTISCWIRADSFGNDSRLVSKATGLAENDHVWMLSTTASNGIKPRMRLKTSSGNTTTLIGTVDLATGVWTHVAATYDGAAMRLWVNGQPAGSLARTGTIIQNPNVPAAIGAQPQGVAGFDGTMDDVRIYTRALDQIELQEIVGGLR